MMTREVAEALQQLRAYLVIGEKPMSGTHNDLTMLKYGYRPNRSLPEPFRVVSFFVYAGAPLRTMAQRYPQPNSIETSFYKKELRLVDHLMKPLTPALMAAVGANPRTMRWRDGGVREWDGMVFDRLQVDVRELIEAKLSKLMFGDTRVLQAEEL